MFKYFSGAGLCEPIRTDCNVFQIFILFFAYYGQRITVCLENVIREVNLKLRFESARGAALVIGI